MFLSNWTFSEEYVERKEDSFHKTNLNISGNIPFLQIKRQYTVKNGINFNTLQYACGKLKLIGFYMYYEKLIYIHNKFNNLSIKIY